MESIIKLKNISKRFGQHAVLKSVSLEIRPGEIHGLVGENGAGKSTLLNILFGRSIINQTGGYTGQIYINGRRQQISTTQDAIAAGIGMVHQEFALIPHMNVAENITIRHEKTFALLQHKRTAQFALIHKKANHAQAKAVLNRLGVSIDTREKIEHLSVTFKQFVELAREINKTDLKLLILDEPTGTLGKEDADRLLEILTQLSAQGIAIILVSHRLEEIMAVCDQITVLRDGEVSGRFSKENYDIEKIAACMIGRTVEQVQSHARAITGRVVLGFRDFSVNMPGETIKNINLDIYEGEVIGIAGLAGHGKLALGNGTLGIYPSTGEVYFNNTLLDCANTAAVLNQGLYLLSEERRETGLLLEHSVKDNIVFSAVQQQNRFLKAFPLPCLRLLDKKAAADFAQESIRHLDIRCRNPQQKVRLLSGGNQQKVCLARALAMQPQVLFVAEPTRGIDIGAKEIILQELLQINRKMGTTIVIASSELDELKRICDRIVIMYEGQTHAVLPADCDPLELTLALSGQRMKAL